MNLEHSNNSGVLTWIKDKIYFIRNRISNNGNYEDNSGQKFIDIEVTNNCNALCLFCPRDKTPETGFMNFETFVKTVERAEEDNSPPIIHICGLGEPLLHPEIIKFVKYLTDKHIFSRITTNASLLTPEMSRDLLKAGLKELRVSVSGIDESYNQIHKLNFSNVKQNLKYFLKQARKKINVVLL